MILVFFVIIFCYFIASFSNNDDLYLNKNKMLLFTERKTDIEFNKDFVNDNFPASIRKRQEKGNPFRKKGWLKIGILYSKIEEVESRKINILSMLIKRAFVRNNIELNNSPEAIADMGLVISNSRLGLTWLSPSRELLNDWNVAIHLPLDEEGSCIYDYLSFAYQEVICFDITTPYFVLEEIFSKSFISKLKEREEDFVLREDYIIKFNQQFEEDLDAYNIDKDILKKFGIMSAI